MKRTFRSVTAILILGVLLLSVVPGAAAAETVSNSTVMQGTTFLDLPACEFGGATVPSTLILSQQVALDSGVLFCGTVEYDYRKTPVQSKGGFAKSILNANDLAGHFEDELDNFQVVNVSVRRKAAASMLNTATARAMSGQDMLLIYLVRKGTREFSLFEIPLASDSALFSMLSGADSSVAAFGDDYWQSSVFQPLSSGVTKTQLAATDAVQSDYTVDVYSEIYTVGQYGDTLTYMISVYSTEDMPNGECVTFLQVTNKWTASTSPTWESNTSPFIIGSYANPVVVEALLTGDLSNAGDAFSVGQFDGSYTTKGAGPVISISLGVHLGPISVDWTLPINIENWMNAYHVNTNMNLLGPNPQSDYVKKVHWSFTNCYLSDIGQNFSARLLAANRSGGQRQRAIQEQWICPVCYDNGSFRSNMTLHTTVSYTSGA